MKIALCLSGHTRNYLQNYPNLMFDVGHPVDVFISTVNQSGLTENTNKDYISYHSQDYTDTNLINIADVVSRYSPKLYTVSDDYIIPSDLTKFNGYKSKHGAKLDQIGMMFYRIYLSNNLKKTYEEVNQFQYDYVIRSRFDVKINYIDLNTKNISMLMDDVSVCDIFFAGNSNNMDRICNLYEWYITQPPMFFEKFNNAEHIFHYYINLLNLNLKITHDFDISFTKDYPIQTMNIKNGKKEFFYGF